MSYYPKKYDIIVVGAGHAGCEAALAAAPPSGTFYDPGHASDVTPLASLGIHEHWNNPTDKLYSGNFGAAEGIELILLHSDPIAGDMDSDGDVDASDLNHLAMRT